MGFFKESGIALTTIVPGTVFGPVLSLGRMSSNEILFRLFHGQLPLAFPIAFEVSHVEDLDHLHRLAFESIAANGLRFLAAGQSITMAEVATCFRERFPTSKAPKYVFLAWVVRILGHFIPKFDQ